MKKIYEIHLHSMPGVTGAVFPIGGRVMGMFRDPLNPRFCVIAAEYDPDVHHFGDQEFELLPHGVSPSVCDGAVCHGMLAPPPGENVPALYLFGPAEMGGSGHAAT